MNGLTASSTACSVTSAGRTTNTKWLTYIQAGEGWLYLCVVIELHNGLVVGWSMSHRQDRQLVIQAVLRALWQREGHEPVLLHSDRSRQFTSEGYQKFLKGQNVICSMSGLGSASTTQPPRASSACSSASASTVGGT